MHHFNVNFLIIFVKLFIFSMYFIRYITLFACDNFNCLSLFFFADLCKHIMTFLSISHMRGLANVIEVLKQHP